MQMVSICVCLTYADVRHMDMHDIYAFFSFSPEIRKKVNSDLWRSRIGEMKFAVAGKNLRENGKGLSLVSMVPMAPVPEGQNISDRPVRI